MQNLAHKSSKKRTFEDQLLMKGLQISEKQGKGIAEPPDSAWVQPVGLSEYSNELPGSIKFWLCWLSRKTL
jgi:hypothetical protein